MNGPSYRIVDEPRPGALAHLVVRPYFPFLALMVAGGWLAWPWFVLNAIAVGSVTRTREIAVAMVGLVGSVLLVFGVALLAAVGALPKSAVPYALLVVTVYKLAFGYALHQWQEHAVALHEHYGGRVRNAAAIVVAGLIGRGVLLAQVPTIVWLVLS